MKITVINLKKIIKYIFIFFTILIIFILLAKSLKTDKTIKQEEKKTSLLKCLKYELPITKVVEENINVEEKEKTNWGIKILSMQIGIFDNMTEKQVEKEISIEPPKEEYIETIWGVGYRFHM